MVIVRKMMKWVVVCMVLGVFFVQQASATTPNESVLQSLKAINIPADLYNQASMYLKENELTLEQADVVVANVNTAAQTLKESGITNFNDIGLAQFRSIEANILAAANTMGLVIEVDYASKRVKVYDNEGKMIFETSRAIKNTGLELGSLFALLGGIAIVAIAGGIYAFKKDLFVR